MSLMKRLKQLVCQHVDTTPVLGPHRLGFQCLACEFKSPGWALDAKPPHRTA